MPLFKKKKRKRNNKKRIVKKKKKKKKRKYEKGFTPGCIVGDFLGMTAPTTVLYSGRMPSHPRMGEITSVEGLVNKRTYLF